MSHRRSKAVTWGGALVSVVVLTGILLSWKDLAVLYYLSLLRENPGEFVEYCEKPVGTLEWRASREYLGTLAGRRALLHHVFAELSRARAFPQGSMEKAIVGISGDCVWAEETFAEGRRCSLHVDTGDSRLARGFGELLQGVGEQMFVLPEYPSWRFRISSAPWEVHCTSAGGTLHVTKR